MALYVSSGDVQECKKLLLSCFHYQYFIALLRFYAILGGVEMQFLMSHNCF